MRKCKVLSMTLAVVLISALLWGCGNGQKGAGQQAQPEVLVNTFQAYESDTPILREYNGSVTAEQEVPVQARVSGYIVEKYIQGGQYVEAGTPLYKIDSRQYQSTLAAAKANGAQARANYENAVRDLGRYHELVQQGAISDQMYTKQQALADQYRAVVEANDAQIAIAADNLNDTIVRAPFSGNLGVNDLPVGNFVAAGQTPLVTISSTAPVYVQFDLSETEYLALARKQGEDGKWGTALKLRLADGQEYGETGSVAVVEQGSGSGNFTVKAIFPNRDHLLRPGMYVHIMSDAEIAKNSILVPTKAVQPMLDKNMVSVVNAEGKVETRPVQVGGTYQQYTVITSGLKKGDVVIVEGQAKVRPGQKVKTHMLTREDIQKESQAPKKVS